MAISQKSDMWHFERGSFAVTTAKKIPHCDQGSRISLKISHLRGEEFRRSCS